jgi:Holliday junction DNA helicase RuvA
MRHAFAASTTQTEDLTQHVERRSHFASVAAVVDQLDLESSQGGVSGENVDVGNPPCRRQSFIKGQKTLAELAQLYDVHPNQITTWRTQLLDGAAGVFGSEGSTEAAEPAIDVQTLRAEISELTLVNDFLAGALGKPEIFNTDQGSQGGLSRSSQHGVFRSAPCIGQGLRRTFSSPRSCEVWHCTLPTIRRCAIEQTMIAKLTGTFDDFGPDWAVIDVGGVGYLVHCSAKTLDALGARGAVVTVHTELQVSENDMRLIGFASGEERSWFRLLTGVQGVGSKMALAVLSALSVEEVQRACAGGDAAMVARAQGVGPKLAARIVNELKDKAGGIVGVALAVSVGSASADAVSALQNLGFKPQVATMAVARAIEELGEGAELNALVRVALKRAAG